MAHLEPVPMPGGAAAIREPWRMAAAYLDQAYAGRPPRRLGVAHRNADRWDVVTALARRRWHAPLTSSAGRLFDAVAALLGVRDTVRYEGQAAIELEQRVDRAERGHYPIGTLPGTPLRLSGVDAVRAATEDLRRGVAVPVVAARFHNGVAEAIVRTCARLRASTGVDAVALSGGVFQNVLLLERTADGLTEAGMRVLVHSRVPPNDGGLSLGQAAVAAARDRLG
jgi:hydrogenase maturation protein HypF